MEGSSSLKERSSSVEGQELFGESRGALQQKERSCLIKGEEHLLACSDCYSDVYDTS